MASPSQFGQLNMFAMLRALLDSSVGLFINAGVPVDGTSGTFAGFVGKGGLLIDTTNGQLYINTNTKASPTWTKLADAVGDLPLARGFILRGSATGFAEALDANDSGKILVGDGTDIASVAVSGDATLAANGALTVGAGAITLAKIAAASLDGTINKVVADVNIIGGLPVLHRIDVPAGVTGDVDVVLTHKTRVVDVWLVKRVAAGGGAGTIQVKNGAAAISNALSIDIADQTIARALTLDDANWEIAAAGTLRVTRTRTASTDETCTVYVSGIRVA